MASHAQLVLERGYVCVLEKWGSPADKDKPLARIALNAGMICTAVTSRAMLGGGNKQWGSRHCANCAALFSNCARASSVCVYS